MINDQKEISWYNWFLENDKHNIISYENKNSSALQNLVSICCFNYAS